MNLKLVDPAAPLALGCVYQSQVAIDSVKTCLLQRLVVARDLLKGLAILFYFFFELVKDLITGHWPNLDFTVT